LSPRIEDRIDELWAHGSEAKNIYWEIANDPELGPDCPDIRTIQRRLHSRRDRSGRWSVVTATIQESTAVLSVLPDVILKTNSAITWVTRAEAAMIARLMPLIAGLRGWDVYLVARAYAMRELAARSTEDLDALLAYQPWSSTEASLAYTHAVALGQVPSGPRYIIDEVLPLTTEEAITRSSIG
jgi:hypothetical protein